MLPDTEIGAGWWSGARLKPRSRKGGVGGRIRSVDVLSEMNHIIHNWDHPQNVTTDEMFAVSFNFKICMR
jgi:hypothetical protein